MFPFQTCMHTNICTLSCAYTFSLSVLLEMVLIGDKWESHSRWFLKRWTDIPLTMGNKQSSLCSDDIPRPRPPQCKAHLIWRGDFFFLCISGSLSVLAEGDDNVEAQFSPSDVLVVLNRKLCYIHICVNIKTVHGEILARHVYASNCRIN